MNEKNESYLKNQVKFLGFGESLDKEISEKINSQEPQFSIQHRAMYGNDESTATLHFTRSKESELYFLNSYDMAVKQGKDNETVKQTFYVSKENNTTAKEAYNLLSGRAVYKEMTKMYMEREGSEQRLKPTGEKYFAWKELNFRQTDNSGNFETRLFFDNHGYDVEKVLRAYQFKELADSYDKSRLIESLKKGNLQRVTLNEDGKETKRFIAANPRDQSITIYDSNMNRLDITAIQKTKQLPTEQFAAGIGDAVQKENKKELKKQSEAGQNNTKAAEKKARHIKIS